ncbi:hypothetical protein NE237_023950 [Protea cynaroides]|uniref:Uncharacterized protein n=1 Tax=Protea cynaroides TaxID=273540 RepID=A0A9Q0HCE4_9MAGN|nr:hypothetical protein NE237_023950 [Protea cynaroides]
MKGNQLESITELHGGRVVSRSDEAGGVVRIKIVVKKQELKKMLATMASCRNNTYQASSSSTLDKQRIHPMRKRHFGLRWLDHLKRKRRPWRPDLQSIPE